MKNTFLKLWAWFTGTSTTLLNFLLPILQSSVASLLEQLAPIALEVVASLADDKRTGDAKRKAAAKEIEAAALAAGISASASLINASIELALQNLKARE